MFVDHRGFSKGCGLEVFDLRAEMRVWLRFLDTFRTLCIAPPAEFRVTLELMRNLRETM
jgi:hypothetical protein